MIDCRLWPPWQDIIFNHICSCILLNWSKKRYIFFSNSMQRKVTYAQSSGLGIILHEVSRIKLLSLKLCACLSASANCKFSVLLKQFSGGTVFKLMVFSVYAYKWHCCIFTLAEVNKTRNGDSSEIGWEVTDVSVGRAKAVFQLYLTWERMETQSFPWHHICS